MVYKIKCCSKTQHSLQQHSLTAWSVEALMLSVHATRPITGTVTPQYRARRAPVSPTHHRPIPTIQAIPPHVLAATTMPATSVPARRMMTLSDLCTAAAQQGAVPHDLAHLHASLASAVKTIAAAVARVGIDDLSGYTGEDAADGRDRQKKLDVVAVCVCVLRGGGGGGALLATSPHFSFRSLYNYAVSLYAPPMQPLSPE